jgi:GntR family transcriptional regulator, histidine utilization repressor
MASIATSLHARIRGDIENRIVKGEWRPGFRVPPEHELMLQYDCSRMTVNKAVASLTTAGLVTRNKRAGTIVAKPPLHSAVLQIPDIRHEIEARGGVYSYACLKVETRKKENAVFVRCLHFDDGVALMLEEREIFLNAIPEAKIIDFKVTPPGSWLIDHVAWTEAEHRISACSADVATANALEVNIGDACLVVDRKTWRGSQTITQVRQFFRSDTYDVVARFSPKSVHILSSPDC